MSLLPEQIIPQTVPIGRVTPSGAVLIDKNWWLLLYNLCTQTLGTQGNSPGLPADALLDLFSADVDAVDADAVALRSPVAQLLAQQSAGPELADPAVDDTAQDLAFVDADVPIGSLPPTNGGTGQTQYTLGDILYSSGPNVLARLAGNTAAARNFLTQTGSGSGSAAPAWSTIQASDLPGGFAGFANPSSKVGLAPVDGSATTAMRSDGAPPIDQSISPTWTGTHSFAAAELKDSSGGGPFPMGYLGMPAIGVGANRTLQLSDRGKSLQVQASGLTFTVPPAVFNAGDMIVIANANVGAPASIAPGTGMSLLWANGGSSSGTRTLTGYGLAIIYFNGSASASIWGGGIS